MTEKYLIAGFIAAIFFIIWLAVDNMVSRKKRIADLERESRFTSLKEEMGFEQAIDTPIELEGEVTGLAKGLEQIMRVLGINMDKALKEGRKTLSNAGIDSPNGRVYFLFYRYILGYIIAVIGLLLMLKGDLLYLSLGGLLFLIGILGANLFVSNQTQKRRHKLVRSFPDSLDLMVVCVESGLALDSALNRVCSELNFAHPELTDELNKTRLELALLNNRSQALANLAERTDVVAFRSLVAALIQTERFGTNLSDTLRVLSDDYRQGRLMLAEEKAGRLPALMAIPLVLFLLPAFLLIVLGPPIIKLNAQGGLFGKN
jgi:tight adherence protein C